MDKRMQEVEEAENRRKERLDTPITPQEELEAELGLNTMPSKTMVRASNILDKVNHKMSISRQLKQESKIYTRQVEADRGRGQNIGADDFRVASASKGMARANSIENEALSELDKVNETLGVASSRVEHTKTRNKEIKDSIEDKDVVRNEEGELTLGQNVDELV